MRLVIGVVNLVLFAVAALLGTVLFLAKQGEGIPVPSILLEEIEGQLRDQGLKAQWDDLRVDLTAGITVHGLQVENLLGDKLLAADQALVQLNAAALLIKQIRVDKVRVDNARLILPGAFAASGTDEAVLQDGMAAFKIDGRLIELQSVVGRLGAVNLYGHGSVELPPASDENRQTLAVTLRQAAQQVQSLQGQIGLLGDASIVLDLDAHVVMVETPSISVEGWTAEGVTLYSDLNNAFRPLAVDARAARVVGPHAVARNVTARIDLPHLADDAPLADLISDLKARAYAGSVEARDSEWRGVCATGQRRANGALSLFVASETDGLPVAVEVSGQNNAYAIHASGRAEEERLLTLAGLPREPILRRIRVHEPIWFDVNATVPENRADFEVDFAVEAWDLNARGTALDHVVARGWADRHTLIASHVGVDNGPAHVDGSFEQDFDTLAWRILLKGQAFPVELGPMLGHWWDEIWTSFVFYGGPVDADVSIIGNWNDRNTADVLGHASGGGFTYNGVPVEKASLSLFIGRGFTELYALRALNDEGAAGGEILILLPRGAPMRVGFDMVSTLPLQQVNQAFGINLEDIIAEWSFERPPTVHFIGETAHESGGDWSVDVQAAAEAGPGSWRGIRFGQLTLNLNHANGETHVRDVRGDFSGGLLSGGLDFYHRGTQQFVADLLLTEAPLSSTLDAFARLGGNDDPEMAESIRAGRVTLSFKGGAQSDDVVATLQGKGSISIKEADLAHVGIFGALSTLLDSVGLGFSTFTFDKLTADYEVRSGRIHTAEMSVDGPNASIHLEGSLGLARSDLDFDARVFLLKSQQPSLMSLFGALLSPLGYFLELHLFGTMEEPDWRFKLDPRNLFNLSGSQLPEDSPAARGPVRR